MNEPRFFLNSTSDPCYKDPTPCADTLQARGPTPPRLSSMASWQPVHAGVGGRCTPARACCARRAVPIAWSKQRDTRVCLPCRSPGSRRCLAC